MGHATSRIGIEARALSHHYFAELARLLPDATLVPVDQLFDEIRMIKSDEEVQILRRGALATDAAIRTSYASSRVGTPDKLIADTMANNLQANGADAVAFLVVGAGPSAALAHPHATDRPVEVGDIVRCDIGGYFAGYYSDLARSGVVGRASDEQLRSYEQLWCVHEALIAAVRPGLPASQLFRQCAQEFSRRNLEMRSPHIGHSLGLGLHEQPMLHPGNHTPLQVGMVLSIEPIHFLSDGTILHVEDQVLVTPEGCEVLSRSADWSELFVIDP
jgi:Xaa-Pro aminopeptidase